MTMVQKQDVKRGQSNSYRQILRSSSVIGGASVVNVSVGILRMKVAAVLLGPSGVGLIGLLQSLMAAASTVSALGFGTVGTRQIAEAAGRDNAEDVASARRALFWGTLALAALGGGVVWILRNVLAVRALHDPSLGGAVGWLAGGVALTVAAGSQGALLTGLRRLADLARVSIGTGVLSTVLGVAALSLWGVRGVVPFVLATPLASFMLGHWFVAKLPPVSGHATPLRVLAAQWKTLIALGTAFMVTGVIWTVGMLLIRVVIQRDLGADALGLYQASWLVGTNYLGVVLAAMGTDYYPRITAVIHDSDAANRLVNEQAEVGLLLAGPIFLGMLGLSPWIMALLYSSKFDSAVTVLRWQVLGDVLKVVSWPLSYVLLAAGDGRGYLFTETMAAALLLGLTWLCLPFWGIEAAGVAYLCLFLVYLPVLYVLARRRTGFKWTDGVKKDFVLVAMLTTTVFVASGLSRRLGAALGCVAATALGFHSLMRLGHRAELAGPVGRLAAKGRSVMISLGVWRD